MHGSPDCQYGLTRLLCLTSPTYTYTWRIWRHRTWRSLGGSQSSSHSCFGGHLIISPQSSSMVVHYYSPSWGASTRRCRPYLCWELCPEYVHFEIDVEALKDANIGFNFSALGNLNLLQEVSVFFHHFDWTESHAEADEAFRQAFETHPNSPSNRRYCHSICSLVVISPSLITQTHPNRVVLASLPLFHKIPL